MRSSLTPDVLGEVDANLAATDAFLEATYPGDTGRRQPVHTVYVPADRYEADLPRSWGEQAAEAVEEFGGIDALCREVGLTEELTAQVGPRVLAKLAREPIEDLRLDFEDGYGDRGDASEDDDVERAAAELLRAIGDGRATPFYGIRFKCFEAPTRARGLRTLDGFLTALADGGALPGGLVLTLPKVSTVSQVEAMVTACEALEDALGLPRGRIGFEVQVETPQLILGADGTVPVVRCVHAGGGRVTSLHYGTFDYSASMGVAAEYQSMEHPVADQAKAFMQLAVAGTGVHLSDGSTNVLPVGDREQRAAAWRLHHRLVTRSLTGAIYQGWDMHRGTCRLASSRTTRSTGRASSGRLPACTPTCARPPVPSWTSPRPRGRWPATSTVATHAGPSTRPSCGRARSSTRPPSSGWPGRSPTPKTS